MTGVQTCALPILISHWEAVPWDGEITENTVQGMSPLRRVRLGLMLLPVLTESGAAAKGLRDEFLRDALRPAEGIKPFIIEQKNHPIYVHNDKSQKRGSRHWKISKR